MPEPRKSTVNLTAGSIVNIAVYQNHTEEKKRDDEFWSLQSEILETFGKHSPEPPKLNVCDVFVVSHADSELPLPTKLRNVTQTSITLEWSPLELATSKLRSLDIYKNRQRLASIPNPLQNTSTKLSGLELDTEYSIQLVLRAVDAKELSVALKGVDQKVRNKVMKNMSERAAANLAEEIQLLGPIKLKTVEEAQNGIVRIIRTLEESGQIDMARGSDELVV